MACDGGKSDSKPAKEQNIKGSGLCDHDTSVSVAHYGASVPLCGGDILGVFVDFLGP